MRITIINGISSFTINPTELWTWDNYISIRYFIKKEYYYKNNLTVNGYVEEFIFNVIRIYDEELIKELNKKPFRRWGLGIE